MINRYSIDGVAAQIREIVKYPGMYDGRCFEFYEAMKELYPESVCMYDGNHVTTLLYGRLWDQSGLVAYPLEAEQRIFKAAHDWNTNNG